MSKISRRALTGFAAISAACLAPAAAIGESSVSLQLSDLIARYALLREQYFSQEDGFKADEVGEVWIRLFYDIVEFPCRTPSDAIAKAKLMVSALDNNEMHIFEDDGVAALRTIATLPQV